MKKYIKKIFFVVMIVVGFCGCYDKSSSQNIKPQAQEKSAKIEPKESTKQKVQKSLNKVESNTTIAAPKPKKPQHSQNKEIKSQKLFDVQTIKRTSTEANQNHLDKFDFDIIKKGFDTNNVLLIVGGIQGDEPGGFMAASLIATHYKIKKGSVWVIPNLNFYSIIKRSRGPHGDMNRKFANLDPNDPEYEIVQRIKSYIEDDKVKMVVNLHDGSGYYRPKYEDKLHSPYRWGQCTIIDQSKIKSEKYADLEAISKEVVQHVNKYLIKDEHKYHIHNTRTNEGDKQMEKTLTYFAINQGKAAFGNEASKELPTHQRVYYHLRALEKFMGIAGVKFQRDFNLNDEVVRNIIDNDISIALYDNRIKLPLGQVRNILNYFPVKKDGTIDFIPSNPLMSIVKESDYYTIYYGNRRLSRLHADFIDHHDENIEAAFIVDGQNEIYNFGQKIKVEKNFIVKPLKDYRINVIGFTDKSKVETGKLITHNDMLRRFSIDKEGKMYRVEFYKDEKFAGMIVVDFKAK